MGIQPDLVASYVAHAATGLLSDWLLDVYVADEETAAQPSDAVVIVGLGGVGLNAINGAVTAGAATIIAIDIANKNLERAKVSARHT